MFVQVTGTLKQKSSVDLLSQFYFTVEYTQGAKVDQNAYNAIPRIFNTRDCTCSIEDMYEILNVLGSCSKGKKRLQGRLFQ